MTQRLTKIATLAVVVALVAGCIAVETHKAPATSPPPGGPTPGGGGVARVAEVVPDGPCRSLAVAYENDTASTFRTVRIRCRALDASGYQVLAEDLLLHGSTVGPLVPGFKLKQTLRVCPPPVADLTFACSVVDTD